jgi:PKD repeat protein
MFLNNYLLVFSLFIFSICTANGQIVTNGSFTGPTGNSQTPPGWTDVKGWNPGPNIGTNPTVDCYSTSFSGPLGVSVVASASSPDGGTWLGITSLIKTASTFENEAAQQTVTGLVPGQTYNIQFYAANFGFPNFTSPGRVMVHVDGVQAAISPVLPLLANNWTTVNGSFIASAAAAVIQVDAIHTQPQGGVFSVDGLTITLSCYVGPAPIFVQNSFCTGEVTFDLTTLSPTNPNPTAELNWYTSNLPSATNQINNASNVDLGSYYAAFFDQANNCYSPVSQININANPQANFSFSMECNDAPIHFTDLSTINSGVINAWSWDFQDGSAGTSQQNPTHTLFPGNTTDSVTLAVTTASGCQDDTTILITYLPLPVISLMSQYNCLHEPVSFTGIGTVLNGTIAQWIWDFGDGSVSNLQNPIHTYSNDGCFDVSLMVVASNGCSSQLTVNNSVCLLPLPSAQFTVSQAALGESFLTYFHHNGSTNATNYIWDFGDGSALSNYFEPTHTYVETPNQTTTLIAINQDGCTDTFSLALNFPGEIIYYVPNSFTPIFRTSFYFRL